MVCSPSPTGEQLRGARHNKRMKLTGAAILVSRGMKVLQAAPAAYPYRSAAYLRRLYAHISIEGFIMAARKQQTAIVTSGAFALAALFIVSPGSGSYAQDNIARIRAGDRLHIRVSPALPGDPING